jgi:predicted metal-binding protein
LFSSLADGPRVAPHHDGGCDMAIVLDRNNRELFAMDYRNTILDLREIRLADRAAVRFLSGCEADGMKLENCPPHIREWMEWEKD